jgi:hypothetical protein
MGQLDLRWGGGGYFLLDSPAPPALVTGIGKSGDTVILSVEDNSGSVGLIRLNATGGPDISFGVNGQVRVNSSVPSTFLHVPTFSNEILVLAFLDSIKKVIINSTSVDSNFGLSGAGRWSVPSPISTHSIVEAPGVYAERAFTAGTIRRTMNNVNTDIIIVGALHNANGSLDLSFSGKGWRKISELSEADNYELGSVIPLRSGKVLVVFGWTSADFIQVGCIVQQYNFDGSLDYGYGTNGSAFASPLNSTSIRNPMGASLSSGSIVLAGRASNGVDLWVNRILPNGSGDLSWNSGRGGINVNSGSSSFSSLADVTSIAMHP